MNQKLREKALRQEERDAATHSDTTGNAKLDERMLLALHAASEKKALDPLVLDLRGIASFTDFFVITSGTNRRQVQAISDGVVENLKKNGTGAARVEGYQTAEWILIDYGDFIVHVFDEKARRFYDLERLWREAARVEVPPDRIGSLREE
jgi:ribosome-associated protein